MAPLKMGMVGGGLDALVGAWHRRAVAIDGGIELVAGALASTRERALTAAKAWNLPRAYASWEQMLQEETRRPIGERIDFVTVATPNHLHYPVAKAFIEAGFNVVCDKPMTRTLEEAKSLAALVARSGVVVALTHNYTGYPLVKQARHMVAAGELGELIRVSVEYSQGWLLGTLEREGHKGATWRTDPARSGQGGAMGDIGTHAENLMRYVTGLEIEALCADLSRRHGRVLDDDGSMLLRLTGGARGVLTASQVLNGEGNDLRIKVYGTRGSLAWCQEQPETLLFQRNNAPDQTYRRGEAYLCPAAKRGTRLPPGHPEAFNEAFANIYANAADTMRARKEGRAATELELDFPTAEDGVRGLAFIAAVVDSDASDAKWTAMKKYLSASADN
jgi:predicted dehydrogenase